MATYCNWLAKIHLFRLKCSKAIDGLDWMDGMKIANNKRVLLICHTMLWFQKFLESSKDPSGPQRHQKKSHLTSFVQNFAAVEQTFVYSKMFSCHFFGWKCESRVDGVVRERGIVSAVPRGCSCHKTGVLRKLGRNPHYGLPAPSPTPEILYLLSSYTFRKKTVAPELQKIIP